MRNNSVNMVVTIFQFLLSIVALISCLVLPFVFFGALSIGVGVSLIRLFRLNIFMILLVVPILHLFTLPCSFVSGARVVGVIAGLVMVIVDVVFIILTPSIITNPNNIAQIEMLLGKSLSGVEGVLDVAKILVRPGIGSWLMLGADVLYLLTGVIGMLVGSSLNGGYNSYGGGSYGGSKGGAPRGRSF